MNLSESINLILFSYLALTTIYLVGSGVSQLIVRTNNESGSKLLFGTIVICSFYAVFRTNFKTVLVLNLLLISFGFYHVLRNKNTSEFGFFPNKIDFRNILKILFVFTLFFTYQYFSHFDFQTGIPYKINEDLTFYGRLSGYLRDFGVENFKIDYFLLDKGGNNPYHYLELWCSALLSHLFSINARFSMILITYPIFYTITYFLVLNLLKTIGTIENIFHNKYLYPFAFAIFFFSSFSFIWPNSIIDIEIFSKTIFEWPKLSIILTFLLCAITHYLKRNYFTCLLIISLLLVNYISLIPATFVCCVAILILKTLKIVQFEKRTIFYLLIPMATIVLISIFYLLFGGENSVSPEFSDFVYFFGKSENLVKAIGIVVLTFAQVIVTSIPFLFLFALNWRKISIQTKLLFGVLFLYISSGIISWSVFCLMHDSVQFWNNVSIPLINLMGFIILYLSIFQNKAAWKKVLSIVFIGGLLLGNISRKRPLILMLENESMISILKGKKVTYIKEAEDYKTYFSKLEHIYLSYPSTIEYHLDPLRMTCISNHLIPCESVKEKKSIANSTFMTYCESLQEKNTFISYSNAQLKFIEEFEVDHLLVKSGREIPHHFLSHFKKSKIGSIDGFDVFEKRAE